MRGGGSAAAVLGWVAICVMAIGLGSVPSCAAGLVTEAQDVDATPALIREIQFMLLRLGMEPGPIDGVVGIQTMGSVRRFQAKSSLPFSDLISNGKISGVFLARLRDEASKVILGGE